MIFEGLDENGNEKQYNLDEFLGKKSCFIFLPKR